MQSEAGVVMTAVVGLWIAYFVPHRLRYRQQLLESRTDDRFSEQLRVVRVSAPAHVLRSAREGGGPQRAAEPTRVLLHPRSARRGGGGTMDRPHAAAERIAADAVRRSAAEHARRVAHLQRRRAGARRRALLTAVLLVAVLVGWGAVVGGSALVLALAPTAALGGVLLLGRRAVISAARADAAWAAGAADRVPLPPGLRHEVVRSARPAVVGRAVRPSDARTEVLARVPVVPALTGALEGAARRDASGTVASAAPATAASAARRSDIAPEPAPEVDERTWSPVPVPRPSYTLKPAAPRREPAPLEAPLAAPVTAAALDAARAADAAADAADDASDALPGGVPEASAGRATRSPQGVGGMDLDQILARRRASGE